MKALVKTCLLGVLFFSTLNGDDQNSTFNKNSSLSNREIDQIFISFEQQAREELIKERKEAQERKKIEAEMMEMKNSKKRSKGGSRTVLSHDGNSVTVADNKIGTPPPGYDSNKAGVFSRASTQGFNISGIICEKRECVAITNTGNVKKGGVLSTGEKIISITKNQVKTDRRIIKF